uniref:Late endosomal/lysosomal adaptor and MAPK and MTOR activator 4 n=1 Tax=Clastoptera arizonana TaxID=38151 RepID=A0A1B6E3E8_9HEMI
MTLERIQDQMGYLILTEDGAVIASGGELENSEHVANIIMGLISLADSILPEEEGYKKISVTYRNFSYMICLSNKKIYVVKKHYSPPMLNGDGDRNTNVSGIPPPVVNT